MFTEESDAEIANCNASDALKQLRRLAPRVQLLTYVLIAANAIKLCPICKGCGHKSPATGVDCPSCYGAGYNLTSDKRDEK